MKHDTFTHLDVQDGVVGARGQQEAPRRVGEFTVVDLLVVLHLEDPQQPGSLYVPHLRGTRTNAVMGGQLKTAGFNSLVPLNMTTHLDFSVTGAGCEEMVVRGEGTAEDLILVGLDLRELLT